MTILTFADLVVLACTLVGLVFPVGVWMGVHWHCSSLECKHDSRFCIQPQKDRP